MKAFKFLIPTDKPVFAAPEDQPTNGARLEFSACVAVALHETAEEAREFLMRKAAEDGEDGRWLKVARVIEIPLDHPARLCWVML